MLVRKETCSGKGLFDLPRKLAIKEAVELADDLPPGGLPTRISADRPGFRELEVTREKVLP
jgi:hypothetical protein